MPQLRKALEALDEQRRRALPDSRGSNEPEDEPEIETIVDTSNDLTPQSDVERFRASR